VFWATGHPAGHVAPCVGPGLVASTDIERDGWVSIVPVGEIARRWGAKLLGLTAWSHGVHLATSPPLPIWGPVMPFRDPIVAGTTLVRDAIQSRNWDPSGGTAGWQI